MMNDPYVALLVYTLLLWLCGFMAGRVFFKRRLNDLRKRNAELELIGAGMMRDERRARQAPPRIDNTTYPFWLGQLRQHNRRNWN